MLFVKSNCRKSIIRLKVSVIVSYELKIKSQSTKMHFQGRCLKHNQKDILMFALFSLLPDSQNFFPQHFLDSTRSSLTEVTKLFNCRLLITGSQQKRDRPSFLGDFFFDVLKFKRFSKQNGICFGGHSTPIFFPLTAEHGSDRSAIRHGERAAEREKELEWRGKNDRFGPKKGRFEVKHFLA